MGNLKKSFALAAAGSVCLAGTAAGQHFTEDFESYAQGANNLAGQTANWNTWQCAAGVDCGVDVDPAGSGSQVAFAEPGDDLIRDMRGPTTGQHVFKTDVYMPSFTAGGFTNTGSTFVIILNQFDHDCDASPIVWSVQAQFNGFTQTVSDDGNTAVTAPLTFDNWGTFTVEIDFDADTFSETWDQDGVATEIVTDKSWTGTVFGGGGGVLEASAFDMFSNTADAYYDNVSYDPAGSSSQAATAVDVTRTLGIFISGDLAAISTSDDVDYVLQTGPGFNPAEPHPARVDVGFDTGGFAASTVDATIEVGSNIGGPTAVVLLQNFTTGAFDEIGRGSFGPGDTTTTYAGVPAGDYINGANRAVVRVRSFFIIVLFPTVRGFTNHDMVGLTLNG